MSKAIRVKEAQRRLMIVWLAGAAIPLLVLFAQTVGGKFGPDADKAFSWLMPHVIPTLLLMVGAVAADPSASGGGARADRTAFQVSQWLSVTYLALLLATLLLQPLSSLTPFQMMKTSELWLGPLQGVVGLSLGAFFVSRRSEGAGGVGNE